ncbi:hypothetical protein HGA64_00540 [Candidatus Falkowbacteria bacterium]|nr:hypothetical protein [Candidatus Falkowbacteria bacterium]
MKKNYTKSLLLFLLPLILSGCSLPFAQKKAEKPEILMAQECGMDGLKCCATSPACSYGQQCCIDPNDPARNRCADTCGCGGKDEFCCSGDNKCNSGLSCQEGLCQECGGEEQNCCNGSTCTGKTKSGAGELVCQKDKCVACGVPGGPCCLNGSSCINNENTTSTVECLSGLCAACGANELPACQSGSQSCLPEHLLSSNICYRCGHDNQPCCDSSQKERCATTEGLVCELGFCKKQ